MPAPTAKCREVNWMKSLAIGKPFSCGFLSRMTVEDSCCHGCIEISFQHIILDATKVQEASSPLTFHNGLSASVAPHQNPLFPHLPCLLLYHTCMSPNPPPPSITALQSSIFNSPSLYSSGSSGSNSSSLPSPTIPTRYLPTKS